MRCTQCDYPLWNLATRACPECGNGFRPSEFQFQPNSVRFCCPHCDQAYYGTDTSGLLVPRTFACRQCERQIDLDEMVLRPEASEEATLYDDGNPWLARDGKTFTGRVGAWFKTCGRALGRPRALMRATGHGRNGQAWWFLALTIVLGSVIAVLPMMCLMGLLPMGIARTAGPGGPGIGQIAAVAGGVSLVTLVFVIVMQFAFVAIWGLTIHGLLAVTGGVTHSMSRTFQCLCYSGGTFVTLAVPFVGQYVATIWWIVSAILMVGEGQKVSGGRASFAVLTFPIVSIVLFCGGYMVLVVMMMSTAAGGGFGNAGLPMQVTEATTIAMHMRSWHDAYGDWPDHALRVSVDGTLGPGSFVAADSLTTQFDVPVCDETLADFREDGPVRNGETLDALLSGWPDNVIAHRVGDFVLTYAGVDPALHPNVWIVVLHPQPDVNPNPLTVSVGMADGSARSFPIAAFAAELAQENARRRSYGLPELDPAFDVTADAPMTGP